MRNSAVRKGSLPPLKLSCIQLTVRFISELNLLLVEAGARGIRLNAKAMVEFRLPPSQLRYSPFPIPHSRIPHSAFPIPHSPFLIIFPSLRIARLAFLLK